MKGLILVLSTLVLIPALVIYDAFAWGYVFYKGVIWFSPIIYKPISLSYHGAIALLLLYSVLKSGKGGTSKKTIDGVEIKEDYNFYILFTLPWFMLLVLYGFTYIL